MSKNILKEIEIKKEKEKKNELIQKISIPKTKRGKTFHFNKLSSDKQDKGIGSLKDSKIEISEYSNY